MIFKTEEELRQEREEIERKKAEEEARKKAEEDEKAKKKADKEKQEKDITDLKTSMSDISNKLENLNKNDDIEDTKKLDEEDEESPAMKFLNDPDAAIGRVFDEKVAPLISPLIDSINVNQKEKFKETLPEKALEKFNELEEGIDQILKESPNLMKHPDIYNKLYVSSLTEEERLSYYQEKITNKDETKDVYIEIGGTRKHQKVNSNNQLTEEEQTNAKEFGMTNEEWANEKKLTNQPTPIAT